MVFSQEHINYDYFLSKIFQKGSILLAQQQASFVPEKKTNFLR